MSQGLGLSVLDSGSPKPRLVLFDIDQTLLHSGGAGMRALVRAIAEVTGYSLDPCSVQPGGKTDPVILEEIVERSGCVPRSALGALELEVWPRYEAHLRLEMAANRDGAFLLPGARTLVERLQACPDICLGLLTGNLERTARVKLEPFGLNEFFPVGGFGSDHRDRERLGVIAIRRASEHYGHTFAPNETWVVGDTRRDIAAARACGARVLGVASGHESQEDLESAGSDAVLARLDPVEAALAVLLR